MLMRVAGDAAEREDVPEESMAELTRFCETILPVCRLTWGELEELDRVELAALLAANRRVEAERIAAAGLAAQGPWGAAAVLSEVDGGQAEDELLARAGLAALRRGR